MSEKLTSVNAEGIFEPFPIDSVPWEAFSRGERYGDIVEEGPPEQVLDNPREGRTRASLPASSNGT